MSYQLIDPIIFPWANIHSLHISTIYKDEEVRSIDLINAKGERFQIWFDLPVRNRIIVHAWNYKKKKERVQKDWSVDIEKLESTLTEVLNTVHSWM